MAFDILSGETNRRSWARGSVAMDIAVAHAKRLPWGKIALGAGIAAGGIFLLSTDKKSTTGHRRHEDDEPTWMNETREIPRESMRKLVLEDPDRQYGRKR
jgi:hypothetical protein